MTTDARLGIIAGGGNLPERIAAHARNDGRNPYVIGITGYVSEAFVSAYDGHLTSIGEIGKQIRLLSEANCTDLVFAGIVRRPDFAKLRLDIKGAAELPRILAAASKGDDTLLRAVIDVFERAGFNVIGADDVFGALLAKAGPLGAHTPDDNQIEDIRLAYRTVQRLGELDIGQAAVARNGVILAVEAQEGTDSMLERCATLPAFHEGLAGVLMKAPKPIQERRIDLPTIGVTTIEKALAARLAGVAFEAGGALIIDQQEVSARANAAGLFLYGVDAEKTV